MRSLPSSLIILLTVFLTPLISQAAVRINEVAWMGSATSANHEWVELYNDGSETVTLDGWTLGGADGSPNITLSGSIGGGSYFLLERTSDESAPGATADQLFTGSLSNEGETLQLKNNGTIVDTADGAGGWPAGDNATKSTMQRSGGSWITAVGTPRAANSSSDEGTPTDSDNDDTDNDDEDSSASSSSSNSTVSSGSFTLSLPKKVVVPVGTPLNLKAKFSKQTAASSARLRWSFGDGGVGKGKEVDHVYEFAGEYLIKVVAETSEHEAVAKIEVQVIEPEVEITAATKEGKSFVELSNLTSHELEIAGWHLVSASSTFVFPEGMLIKSKGQIRIPASVSALLLENNVQLRLPSGEIISQFDMGPYTTAPASSEELLPLPTSAPAPDLPVVSEPAEEVLPPVNPPVPEEPLAATSVPRMPTGLEQAAGPGIIELPKMSWTEWGLIKKIIELIP